MIFVGILHPSSRDEPIDMHFEHGISIKDYACDFVGKPITFHFEYDVKIGRIERAWVENDRMYILGKIDMRRVPSNYTALCISYTVLLPERTVIANGCGLFKRGDGFYKTTEITQRFYIKSLFK